MKKYDIQLPEQFLKKFPEMSREKADKLHNKYLNITRKLLFVGLPHIQGDIIAFPLKKAFDLAGEFQYQNERYYVWKEFYAIQPFFNKHKEHNRWYGLMTEVKIIDQKYLDFLIDTGDSDILVEYCYSKYDQTNMVMIPIDMYSLTSYIDKTSYTLTTLNPEDSFYHKLLRNLRTAKYFKIISEYFYDTYNEYMLPHIPSDKIAYGRRYYKGINLQNCSKEVRTAALGDHISYDLNAAAYAVKLILAESIYEEYGKSFVGSFTYTKEYLDHKSEIRIELANTIKQYIPNHPNTLKLIKEAMNAIGFGAKIHEGSWEVDGLRKYSALHYIIYNKKARQAFTQHDFVVEFLKEQNTLNNIIYEYYSRNTDFICKVKDIPDMYNNNGKMLKSKVLAYLYQHMETMIMDIVCEPIVPRLGIHDSFIMMKPINNNTLIDIKSNLQNISPYLQLVKEEHSGWISHEIKQQELEHQQFIEEQERIANKKYPELQHKKYTKPYEFAKHHNDGMVYDSYDDGSQYDEYNPNVDNTQQMTPEERNEHYRIIGYNPLPKHIQQIMENNK